MRCRLCGTEIVDEGDSRHCGYCSAVFHTDCIRTYLYHNKDCPSCKGETTLFRMVRGMPHTYKVNRVLPRTIRKPFWSANDLDMEVPFFDAHSRAASPPVYRELAPRFTIIDGRPVRIEYDRVGLLRRFLHTKKGMIGVIMLIAAVVIAVLSPYLVLHDPIRYLVEDPAFVNHSPTWEFPLGTDVLGRDVFSQIIWGFRNAVLISFPSAGAIGLLGTLVGLIAGYYGGIVDTILQRVSVTLLLFPSIPFVALIVHSWGPTEINLALILGVSICLWPTAARAIRAEVKSLKTRTFIEAAQVSGAGPARIIFRHILPNVQHLTFLYMTIGVAFALSLEATVNFLGLGNVHVLTWGQMLSFTFVATKRTMTWWTILPPGLAIAYMVLGSFLISEGIRDVVGRSASRV
ncbi:MAG: ABC transporter permease subunit [Theionarchaea archaeon]|nr:ABC transporter permease subunit [Theionarchaea archaeon]